MTQAARSQAGSGPPPIGAAVRDRRHRLGLTLQAVAVRAGLSAPFISQVERGLASPSITSLIGIAAALGVDIDYFVGVPRPGQIVRRGSAPDLLTLDSPIIYQRLSGSHAERKMEALLMVVPSGAEAAPTRRDGEGFWYVLEGALTMTVGQDSFELSAGDSAHFDQRHPYAMRNPGLKPLRLLWVGSPAIFED